MIANCVFSEDQANHGDRLKCVGFENPGSVKIVRQYLMSKYHLPEVTASEKMNHLSEFVSSYQGDVNIINTCNSQWGKVFHVEMPYRYQLGNSGTSPTDKIDSSYLSNLHYLTTYTRDQHEMSNLLNHIANNIPISDASSRRHGFISGYKQYLNTENRINYWRDYISYVWNHNQQTQVAFQYRFDFFTNFMLSVINEASKQVENDKTLHINYHSTKSSMGLMVAK